MLFTILVILNNVILVSIAYFLKLFIDIATGDIEISLSTVAIWAVIVISLGGVITILISIYAQTIQRKIERDISIELMSIILTRKFIDITKQPTGVLLTRLTLDVNAVSNTFVSIIKNLIGGVFLALLAIAALFLLNWKMAVIMLILSPALLGIIRIFGPKIKSVSEVDKLNEGVIITIIQESLSRVMLIKTFFMNDKMIKKTEHAYEKKINTGKILGKWEGFISFSGMIIVNAMFMVALGVGAIFVLNGETTVGSLIAIVQLLNFVLEPISYITNSISQISQSIVSANRIGELYDLPSDNNMKYISPVNAIKLSANNISFSYNLLESGYNVDYVFEGATASLVKGEITGIIGKSGCGKSTLLKTLIGIYTPNIGSVELMHSDGILIGDQILSQIAYVPPDDYLFSGTVSDNIIMSSENSCIDALKNAAIDADIFEFIQTLPEGFDSPIGENGGSVSSGQAQRIAIARAIYARSPIIVFDEPTANLDCKSIERFHSTVRKLAENKICIIATHDKSTISICDKLYLLENGHLSNI